MDVDEPVAPQYLVGTSSESELSQIKQQLSGLLRDKAKRKALLKLRGDHAQSWIDGLNYLVLHPDIRRSTEPWLLKHTVIILRQLCEVSTLYPTCYVLGDIRDITYKNGGGFCDIAQGRFKEHLFCLKVVRLYQDSNITQLLKAHAREAILWGQLDHPNIIPFYGIFYLERKERICLVSPWMEHGDIVGYLQRVPDAPRKPFIDDIANGLQYLHSQNIVHGDLKGRNVLIDDHRRACLADFGLSTIITNETLGFARTTISASGHTTRWASPELLEEYARPTRETDMWAFGCLCYEVLTGIEPFMGCSDISVVAKLLRRELPARLDNIRLHPNEHLDKKLRDLVGRCWSIEAERRPQCPEILQELEVPLPQQNQCHTSRIPNPFWLCDPGSPSDLGQFRVLLEQFYQEKGVDGVLNTVDLPNTLELEDQTLRWQNLYDMLVEGIEILGEEEEPQQMNEEPNQEQEALAGKEMDEEEEILIAMQTEIEERFQLEQMRVQQMMQEWKERFTIGEEAERKRRSAWAKMTTKDRLRMLQARKRDERFKQEQGRLRQQREHQMRPSSADAPNAQGPPAWSYATAVPLGSVTSSKTHSQPPINPITHSSAPLSFRTEPKNIDEQIDESRHKHLELELKRHEFFYQAYMHHEDQWEWLLPYKRLNWDYFPWPMSGLPESAEEITVDKVLAYLVQDDSNEIESARIRGRIMGQIKKWHPDRFETQWLPKVVEHQKQIVKEGAEKVTKCLNELLLVFGADETCS